MDLLRAVLQPSFNDDIMAVFRKYQKVRGLTGRVLLTDVNRFEQVWTDANRCEQVWTDANRCEQMRTDVSRCEQMRTGVNRCEQVWTDANRCEQMWTGASRCEQVYRCFWCSHVVVCVAVLWESSREREGERWRWRSDRSADQRGLQECSGTCEITSCCLTSDPAGHVTTCTHLCICDVLPHKISWWFTSCFTTRWTFVNRKPTIGWSQLSLWHHTRCDMSWGSTAFWPHGLWPLTSVCLSVWLPWFSLMSSIGQTAVSRRRGEEGGVRGRHQGKNWPMTISRPCCNLVQFWPASLCLVRGPDLLMKTTVREEAPSSRRYCHLHPLRCLLAMFRWRSQLKAVVSSRESDRSQTGVTDRCDRRVTERCDRWLTGVTALTVSLTVIIVCLQRRTRPGAAAVSSDRPHTFSTQWVFWQVKSDIISIQVDYNTWQTCHCSCPQSEAQVWSHQERRTKGESVKGAVLTIWPSLRSDRWCSPN